VRNYWIYQLQHNDLDFNLHNQFEHTVMEKEFIYIAIAMIAVMTTVMSLLLIYINKKKEQRNVEKETKAELSYMREYFEKQLYEINIKLTHDSEKWKEVNHLLLSYKPNVDGKYFDSRPVINDSFFKNFRINPSEFQVRKDSVFVLTPFHKVEDDTYISIQKVCNDLNLSCKRGDEEFIKGDIFSYILKNILNSRIVVANINGRNPNVFYELGLAQAIGKPTLIISKNLDDIPFDVKSQNVIIYNDFADLQQRLSKTLKNVLISN